MCIKAEVRRKKEQTPRFWRAGLSCKTALLPRQARDNHKQGNNRCVAVVVVRCLFFRCQVARLAKTESFGLRRHLSCLADLKRQHPPTVPVDGKLQVRAGGGGGGGGGGGRYGLSFFFFLEFCFAFVPSLCWQSMCVSDSDETSQCFKSIRSKKKTPSVVCRFARSTWKTSRRPSSRRQQ